MPKHRGLTLSTFVRAIPWDLFDRYVKQLDVERKPTGWALLNADAMMAFLDEPENVQISGVILEDFRRINDICGDGMSLLVRAYDRFGIDLPQNRSAQEMSMRLFLEHRDAFEFAWTRYLFFSSPARLSHYRLQVDGLRIGDEQVARFKSEVEAWFAKLAKGDVCEVSRFEDAGDTIIRVCRGSYMRTVACWEGDRIHFRVFRPADEDVLVYDPKESLLSIKARLAKDRDEYLQAFASHIVDDPTLAEAAAQRHVFSLAPLQDGTFDFAGDGAITGIELVKVRLGLYAPGSPVVEVKSEDVLETLHHYVQGLTLSSGELRFARFRFDLQPEGERPVIVSFEVEPPARTDLAQKRYSEVIERYLVEQGVIVR
jgi:hypothetical protein